MAQDLFSDFVFGQEKPADAMAATLDARASAPELDLFETFAAGAQSGVKGLKSDLEYFKAAGQTIIGDDVGAAESVPLVQVTNLARTMKHLQELGVWIIGTAGETDTCLYDVKLSGPMALVMGAEGKGMRRLTRENCDQLVKLPMAGVISSLNVSVATGICLFEIVRQRQQS
jgi:tRNA(Leu) C34 or U34 (ribose-2'-O)-methylase TrmL